MTYTAFAQQNGNTPAPPRSPVINWSDDPNWWGWLSAGDRLLSEDTLLQYRLNDDLRVYEEIEDDAYLGRLCEERRESPFRKPWLVEPASQKPIDLLAAEIIRQLLKQINFDKVCSNLNQAIFCGRSIVEMVGWREQELELKPKKNIVRRTVLLPTEVMMRDPARLVFALAEDDGRSQFYEGFQARQLTRSNPCEGEPLPLNCVIIHSHGSRVGNPYGKGVYRRLYWLATFKKQVLKIGIPALESKALPYLTYTGQATEEEIGKAKKAIADFYRIGWMAIPDSIVVSFLERFHQGRIDSIKSFLEWFDMQCATSIVGQTLTSKHQDSAGRGDSKVHYQVGEDRAKIDADMLSESLRKMLCEPIVRLNLAGAKAPTIYRDFTPPRNLLEQAEIDTKLHSIGYKRSSDSVKEIYGEGYEEREEREERETEQQQQQSIEQKKDASKN